MTTEAYELPALPQACDITPVNMLGCEADQIAAAIRAG